ncbi:hypothetical protein DYB37_006323 [Aphanomyces astaci]|uniref:Dienelactone hydrolase domain-containing protein n=1 Tax=Aphanomyces astaci TaxID=112090 RepID=A0A418EW06_APHAT|nr:hypothetical protein DYB35_008079 [Aphanomyces astaci]RHZ19764.1 hypothetical protein DYB37_006323 [Aphanomyces astaci]
MLTAAAAAYMGAGSIVEWRDEEESDISVQAYLVYPDAHVGRIMTGVVIVPDCAGFRTPYVCTFADKLAEQGYKVIVLDLPVTTATSDEWTNSGTFRKWKDTAAAVEASTVRWALRCRDLLKQTYEVQRVGVLGLGYGAEVAVRIASSFDAVALLSPTALPPPSSSTTPTLLVTGDRNEYIDSSKVVHALALFVVPGQRHGFALSRIADEDAATLAIADILDWFIIHLHRFRTALCTSDGTSDSVPPKPAPVSPAVLFEDLSSMKRTYDLPHPMTLADLVEIYVDIWDINQ